MSESTKSVPADGASAAPQDHPDAVLDGALERVPDGARLGTSGSVRELLAELAQLEDATRGLGGVRRPVWTAQTPDLLAALAREQEIIDELHRRCPDARRATSSAALTAPAADEDRAPLPAD
jgi:hypothetical protein